MPTLQSLPDGIAPLYFVFPKTFANIPFGKFELLIIQTSYRRIGEHFPTTVMLSSILLVRAKSGIVVSHASRYVTRSYGVSLPITTSRAFQSKSQSLGQSAVALRYDESEVSPLAEPRGPAYWQNIWRWRDISEAKFLTHQFQVSNTVM